MSALKLTPMKCTNLFHRFQEWTMEEYNTLCAMTKIDIVRPEGIRWTYTLIFEVYPTAKGVDGRGSRGSGGARPTIIDGTPKPEHTLVEIGTLIKTPFGIYRVEWASKTDHDNIKLFELKES